MDSKKAKAILRRTGELIGKTLHFAWMCVLVPAELAVITLCGILAFYGVFLVLSGEYMGIILVFWFGAGGILMINEEATLWTLNETKTSSQR